MKEPPIHGGALHEPHRARVGVRQDRLGSVRRLCDRAQAFRHLVERFVPAHPGKASAPFGADAPHWVEQSIAMIGPFDVPVDLGAEKAAGEWMVRIARNLHRAPSLDRHEHRACVGAVVWACATHGSCFELRHLS
jgi:hypothetical protein